MDTSPAQPTGCPECGSKRIETTLKGEKVIYQCLDCRHLWPTRWVVDVDGVRHTENAPSNHNRGGYIIEGWISGKKVGED